MPFPNETFSGKLFKEMNTLQQNITGVGSSNIKDTIKLLASIFDLTSPDNIDDNCAVDFPIEQMILYAESPEFSERAGKKLSLNELKEAFEKSLSKVGLADNLDGYRNGFRVHQGVVATFVSSKGSAVMKWDGATGVEVNVLATDERAVKNFDNHVKSFQTEFLASVPNLKPIARDSFPRGHGKVVNFQHEIVEKGKAYDPHWIITDDRDDFEEFEYEDDDLEVDWDDDDDVEDKELYKMI